MRLLLTADPEIPVPPSTYGGVQLLVAQWVKELRSRGHQVAVMAHRDSRVECDGLFPWPADDSRGAGNIVRNAFALRRAARDFRAELVHSSSRLLYTWPLLRAGRPVVMTYHRVPGRRQIALARQLGPRLAFTGVSEFITALGRHGGGDWTCVPNGVDLTQLTFRGTVPEDAPLLYLSRIDADKGAHLAIRIAQRAGQRLVLAGNHSADAAAAAYWRERVEPHIDGRLVSYVGPVGGKEKDRLLGSARALLVPTQCDEAFGLVFAEALACGTPAIGSRRGAVPELIEEGRTGFLIEGIEDGAAAVQRVGQIVRADCRHAAESRLSILSSVDRYETLYRRLVAP